MIKEDLFDHLSTRGQRHVWHGEAAAFSATTLNFGPRR
jgi:hypothetical protein